MKSALLLIDMQKDYLAAGGAGGLQPPAGEVTEKCRALLDAFRAAGLPVIHILTTITRVSDNRMPHWKSGQRWLCEAGTPGHQSAAGLEPLPSETVVHKQFFSGFDNPLLENSLRAMGCEKVVLAGIHLHGCVRTTALDAYARGFLVCIAGDAVTSDDPVHAAITRRYLAARSLAFEPVSGIVESVRPPAKGAMAPHVYRHFCPADRDRLLWEAPVATAGEIAMRTEALAGKDRENDPTSLHARAATLHQLADALLENCEALAIQIMRDVGKPIMMARGEMQRSVALLRAVTERAADRLEEKTSDSARCRRRPLGVIALFTPWNNPLAIPVGKLAPAILYGNAVLWKPALPGSRIAKSLLELWKKCDRAVPIELITGDTATAVAVASEPRVDAVTLSGSELAGYALAEIAARRSIPYQAELGGNNAAIVAGGADLSFVANKIATGAFGFAGQRCTANRRVIVLKERARQFREEIIAATRALSVGDPADEATEVGPVISAQKERQLGFLVDRACRAGATCYRPGLDHKENESLADFLLRGHYHYPSVIFGANPDSELVQYESFGPLLVVQEADSFDHAIALCNGVRQGLVAALFGGTPDEVRQFLARARAGVLKLNQSTVEADAVSPFGGWKCSGIGPPEHGPADRDFFTRMQTLYQKPC